MGLLEPFYKAPFFTIEEAAKQGVPRHALAYLEKEEIWKGFIQVHIVLPVMNPKLNFSGRI